MFKFEELRVYQEALSVVDFVYENTKKWPKDEQFVLISQIRRAVVSIVLNIAEGSSRGKKDFGHFLDISKGSCFECVAILAIAGKRGYITSEEYDQYHMKFVSIAKMLTALKSAILKQYV